jgi:hypothetical protein
MELSITGIASTVALLTIVIVTACVMVTNAVCYVLLTPTLPVNPHRTNRFMTGIGHTALAISTILSLLRLPFCVLPYAAKFTLFLLTKGQYNKRWRSSNMIQLMRLLGDFLNFYLTINIITLVAYDTLDMLVVLSALAESIRLITEKGQMLVSAAWQLIPHRKIAPYVGRLNQRYTAYYCLSDEDRLAYIIKWLAARSAGDEDAAQRLRYVWKFQIVGADHGLGAGDVRNVANGAIYVHRSWTADPFLLIGQAMRRSPYLFDPRYLPRPFYYRTQANRLASTFVLTHAAYSPPYAWFQFGHEIKVARYEIIFRLVGLFGLRLEQPVRENGSYEFEPLLGYVAAKFGWQTEQPMRPLWSDAEVIADVMKGNFKLTPQQIAERYAYPLCYVEEVLVEKIAAVREGINPIPDPSP